MRKIFEKNGYVKKFLNRFFLYFFKRNILQNVPTKDAVPGKEFFHLLRKGVIDRLVDFAESYSLVPNRGGGDNKRRG